MMDRGRIQFSESADHLLKNFDEIAERYLGG